eukprot:7206150-Pyramimonas_sp.AAC.1
MPCGPTSSTLRPNSRSSSLPKKALQGTCPPPRDTSSLSMPDISTSFLQGQLAMRSRRGASEADTGKGCETEDRERRLTMPACLSGWPGQTASRHP